MLGEGVAAFLEKLPEWQKNAEANLRLLERSLKALEESGHKSAGYILSVYEITALDGLAPAELTARLFEMTAAEDFIRPLMEFYADTGLRPARGPLHEEAHRLHRERRFAGSVMLFYSQIEGVLTDALVELGHAKKTNAGVVASGGGKLPGLDAKLKLAKAELEQRSDIFRDLLEALLVASDMGTTVPKSRNAVLHGSDVDFATEARSTQMCLWLGAILVELRPVLSVTAIVRDTELELTQPA